MRIVLTPVSTSSSAGTAVFLPNSILRKYFRNLVASREEQSCLALKKEYLEQACKCTQRHLDYSFDDALHDQTFEAYSAIRKKEAEWRDKGILNEKINKWVAKAAEVRDCVNLQTLETLHSTEKALDLELQSISAPPEQLPQADLSLQKPQ